MGSASAKPKGKGTGTGESRGGMRDPMTEFEKKLINKRWISLIKENPDIFAHVWERAVDRNPTIKVIFGMSPTDSLQANPSFIRLTRVVEQFFHRVIIILDLDQLAIANTCKEMGERHLIYTQNRGFTAMYWDIFMICLNREFEVAETKNGVNAKSLHTVHAWKKLVDIVVEHMRNGLEEAENKYSKDMEMKKKLNMDTEQFVSSTADVA